MGPQNARLPHKRQKFKSSVRNPVFAGTVVVAVQAVVTLVALKEVVPWSKYYFKKSKMDNGKCFPSYQV